MTRTKTLALLLGSGLFSVAALAGQLTVDPSIQVVSVNGKAVSSPVSRIVLTGEPQLLLVRYEQLFELSSEQHDFVRSDVQFLSFDAHADTDYRLSAPSMDWDRARQFAKQPQFMLSDDDEQAVAHGQWSRDLLLTELLQSRAQAAGR
ncbi:DUF2057 family protein [Ferrimonas gelatinilytica]